MYDQFQILEGAKSLGKLLDWKILFKFKFGIHLGIQHMNWTKWESIFCFEYVTNTFNSVSNLTIWSNHVKFVKSQILFILLGFRFDLTL